MKLFKKVWDKVLCSFELQEYGSNGGKGWNSIIEPTGNCISKAEAREMFRPDRHYRVIARALEGEQAGRFIGVVWDHYEPARGLVKKEDVRERAPPKSKEIEDVIDEYAEKVEKVLAPIPKILDSLEGIRQKFAPSPEEGVSEARGEGYEIPPPEFEGKLPAFMHPFVVKTIADEIKGVMDYGATRFQQAFGAGTLPSQQPRAEEEEEVIPSLAKFKERRHPVEEQAPPAEAEEEEEVVLPTIKKKEEEEAPAGEEEVVPTLIEEAEAKPCAQCGRTDVSLNPNGLCDGCLAKLSKEETREEEEEPLLPERPPKRRKKDE